VVIVAALAAPREAVAAVLGVAASARTVVTPEARGAAVVVAALVVEVVRPGARGAVVATAALVVKVVATAATAAPTAATATAVEMEAKTTRRTFCNGASKTCTSMVLLCTGCWGPCYSTGH
jgi:hypothetical protein